MQMKVFTGNANVALAREICDYLGLPLGAATVGRFPDGEIRVKVEEDVRGKDVFVVQPTCPPRTNDYIMELLLMIDSFRRSSAKAITAVIPYYGYGRQDRKDEGRVPISSKLVANLIEAAGADRVVTMDLHSSQIQAFFYIPVDHLFAAPVLYRHFMKIDRSKLVVCSDDGSVKMGMAHSQRIGVPLAVYGKKRISPTEVMVHSLIGEVKGKDVLIIDDVITTMGSIYAAALFLKDRGAEAIHVGATHGAFCGESLERLRAEVITEVAVTNTVPVLEEVTDIGVKVLSIAELLGEAMKRIHENRSVSSLFQWNSQ
jgi:ribose-phosphate pyrophosphokinase